MEQRLVAKIVADATNRLGGAFKLPVTRTEAFIAKVFAPKSVHPRVHRQASHVVAFEWGVAR